MMAFSDGICPLCSRFLPREQLINHIASEHPRVRQSTIQVIRSFYPGWLEEHGACGICWRSYREAGRILEALKRSRPQSSGSCWKASQPAGANQDKVQTRPHEIEPCPMVTNREKRGTTP